MKASSLSKALNSDAELLRNVAARRCSVSFTELVMRYERIAYSIALNITCCAMLAEDATQEAMLRVWLSAERFDPDGCARGWILSIVAREALKKVRDRRKAAEKVGRAAQQNASTLQAKEPATEHEELSESIRNGLEGLPELNRQLVVLYYGVGMSQAQIGKSVGLSQRMVGYKLDEALKFLRSRLAQAGFAAAAPALGDAMLAQAVCSGHVPPPNLYANMMDRLDIALAHSATARASASAAAAQGSSMQLWVAACIILAAAAGGWYALLFKEPPVELAKTNATPSNSFAADRPSKKTDLFHRVWNFNDGASSDFIVLANPWQWRREADGVGRMVAQRDEPTNLFIDVDLPRRPFVIHLRAIALGDGLVRNNFLWADQVSVMPHQVWSVNYTFKKKNSRFDLYFFDRFVCYRTEDRTQMLQEYETPYPGNRFIAVMMNFRVQEIEMRELNDQEVADFAFDPQVEIANLKNLKAEISYNHRQFFRNQPEE